MPPTPKDDIYALGCIAHELLTRMHPYNRVVADKAKENRLTVKQTGYLNNNEYNAIRHAVELDKDKRVDTVNEFLHEFSGLKSPPSSTSSYPVKTLGAILIALIGIGTIYTTIEINKYESITAQQAVIAKKPETDNTLRQAENYLNNGESSIADINNALILFQNALKMDPNNLQAKSGVARLKEIYIQRTENAINANQLAHTSELLKTLEVTFQEQEEFQHLKESLNRHLTLAKIESLHKKANQEEYANLYVRPENGNAYDTYLEILELSPDDPRAIQGIERVRNSIITATKNNIQNKEWKKAEILIKDALSISPGSSDAVVLFN